MLHSLWFWAQVVYQVQSDSCAGWPTVNRVSDRPLLLLIVSISVLAEKWDYCGQTQAIDLWLVVDLPGATAEEWEWRPRWSFHDTPRLPVWAWKSIWCRWSRVTESRSTFFFSFLIYNSHINTSWWLSKQALCFCFLLFSHTEMNPKYVFLYFIAL